MQRERASMDWYSGLKISKRDEEEKKRSKISGRDLKKTFGEFKTVNSLLMTKYYVTT
jgi:hypothetical protein